MPDVCLFFFFAGLRVKHSVRCEVCVISIASEASEVKRAKCAS
jgi:hypothetical protein